MCVKGFSGYRWWEQKNPSFRDACRRKASEELIEMKVEYDYFIKKTSKLKL